MKKMKTRIRAGIAGLVALALGACGNVAHNKYQGNEYKRQVNVVKKLLPRSQDVPYDRFQIYLCYELTGDDSIDQVIAYQWCRPEIFHPSFVVDCDPNRYQNYVAAGVPDSLLLIKGSEIAMPDSMRNKFSEILNKAN
jgi:hypothetical protein